MKRKYEEEVYKGSTTPGFSCFINHTDIPSTSPIREYSLSSSQRSTSTSTTPNVIQISKSYNMHYATTCVLILAAIGLPTALGSPRPQFICDSWDDYKITSQEELPGPSQQGDYSVSGDSGSKFSPYRPSHRSGNSQDPSHIASTLSQSTSYSVGVTIDVGLNIGLVLGEIVSAGLTSSVSISTTTGTTDGAGDTCPKGGWYCSLDITPTMVKVSGTVTPRNSCIEGAAGPVKPYTVTFPKTGSDNIPYIDVRMCTCQNLAHCK